MAKAEQSCGKSYSLHIHSTLADTCVVMSSLALSLHPYTTLHRLAHILAEALAGWCHQATTATLSLRRSDDLSVQNAHTPHTKQQSNSSSFNHIYAHTHACNNATPLLPAQACANGLRIPAHIFCPACRPPPSILAAAAPPDPH